MRKPHRQRRLSKKSKGRAAKAEKHIDGRTAHAAFSYASNRSMRGRLGRMGPASEARFIDPDDVDLSKYLSDE